MRNLIKGLAETLV